MIPTPSQYEAAKIALQSGDSQPMDQIAADLCGDMFVYVYKDKERCDVVSAAAVYGEPQCVVDSDVVVLRQE